VVNSSASHGKPYDSRYHGVAKVTKATRLCGHLFLRPCHTTIAWTVEWRASRRRWGWALTEMQAGRPCGLENMQEEKHMLLDLLPLT
jgi:hypothetical protein